MKFHWILDEDVGIEDLFVGKIKIPIASIMKSNKGKYWSFSLDLPIDSRSWKRYWPREDLKETIEKAVESWFELAQETSP